MSDLSDKNFPDTAESSSAETEYDFNYWRETLKPEVKRLAVGGTADEINAFIEEHKDGPYIDQALPIFVGRSYDPGNRFSVEPSVISVQTAYDSGKISLAGISPIPNTPDDILIEMLESDAPDVAQKCSNIFRTAEPRYDDPGIQRSSDIIDVALKHSNPNVVEKALKQDNLTDEQHARFLVPDEDLKALYAVSASDFDMLDVSDELENKARLFKVALRLPKTTGEQLHEHATNPDPTVRAIIASHKNTLPDDLDLLSTDPEDSVIFAAMWNDSFPEDRLASKANGNDTRAQKVAAANPRTPASALLKLYKDNSGTFFKHRILESLAINSACAIITLDDGQTTIFEAMVRDALDDLDGKPNSITNSAEFTRLNNQKALTKKEVEQDSLLTWIDDTLQKMEKKGDIARSVEDLDRDNYFQNQKSFLKDYIEGLQGKEKPELAPDGADLSKA